MILVALYLFFRGAGSVPKWDADRLSNRRGVRGIPPQFMCGASKLFRRQSIFRLCFLQPRGSFSPPYSTFEHLRYFETVATCQTPT